MHVNSNNYILVYITTIDLNEKNCILGVYGFNFFNVLI